MHDVITLRSPHGEARVHALGATVLSWVPTGQPDVLWCSPLARFKTTFFPGAAAMAAATTKVPASMRSGMTS